MCIAFRSPTVAESSETSGYLRTGNSVRKKFRRALIACLLSIIRSPNWNTAIPRPCARMRRKARLVRLVAGQKEHLQLQLISNSE